MSMADEPMPAISAAVGATLCLKKILQPLEGVHGGLLGEGARLVIGDVDHTATHGLDDRLDIPTVGRGTKAPFVGCAVTVGILGQGRGGLKEIAVFPSLVRIGDTGIVEHLHVVPKEDGGVVGGDSPEGAAALGLVVGEIDANRLEDIQAERGIGLLRSRKSRVCPPRQIYGARSTTK